MSRHIAYSKVDILSIVCIIYYIVSSIYIEGIMNNSPKIKLPKLFELSSVNNQYAALGAVLLVLESILIFWMSRAEGGVERGFAGLLMVIVLIGFLFTVSKVVQSLANNDTHPIIAQGLDTPIQPAQNVVTEQEILNPPPKTMASPDGSYIVNQPPTGWHSELLSYSEFVGKSMRISDPSIIAKLAETIPATYGANPRILCLEASREVYVTPIPGKTIINGRKFPTALEAIIPFRLTIIPMERFQAPLFVEHSLEHNTLLSVAGILGLGVVNARNISRGNIVTPDGTRPYLLFEFRQELRNAIVDNQEGVDIDGNTTLFGIQGVLQDHLLIMNYPSSLTENVDFKRELETLTALVNSFQPKHVADDERRKQIIKDTADQHYQDFIHEKGEQLFITELVFLLFRLKNLDMNNTDHRLKIINSLKPFKTFAKEINLNDAEINKLMNALDKAEIGDATELKLQINSLLAEVNNSFLQTEKIDDKLLSDVNLGENQLPSGS